MTNTSEFYEKYYSATVQRYYSAKEKRKLIGLFAAAYGISESSSEFLQITEVIESVEKFGIETLMDCKNFLLIADAIPGKKELLKAVRAAKLCFEKYDAAGRRTYSDVVDWRTEVYKTLSHDAAAKLDAAYIEYARGAVDKAIGRFTELAEDMAHLPSVEHLAVIYENRADYAQALFWLTVLSDVLRDVLNIDCPESVGESIEKAESKLKAAEKKQIVENAKRKVKQKFSYGQISRGSIGFQPRT